jgi:hypothetical protein
VPPDAEAVKLTEVPAVPVVGAVVKLTASVIGATVIVWLGGAAVAEFPSITVRETVLDPFVAYVCMTGFPVPSAVPSPKFQVNEYGVVPPDTAAVNVTGLPTVGLALTEKLA